MPTPTRSDRPGDASRVVLLVSEPGVDGCFQYVARLSDHLLGTGWTVHLAYSSVRPCPALFELVERVRAAGGQTLDLRVGNSPGAADLGALARLRGLARKTQPRVLHAHSSKAGALARVLPLLGVRARHFYTPHAYYQMNEPASARKHLFALIERVLGRVGTTICVSPSEADYGRRVLGIPGSRLVVTCAGVDCQRFRPAATPGEKLAARAAFGLPPDVPLLGTVARYSAQKDPTTLYAALRHALERHPALCFAHLGKGELAEEVTATLKTFPPAVAARIYRVESSGEPELFYRALDGFLLPSRYEGLALSALEAVATGLSLLVSDSDGNRDLGAYGLNDIRWCRAGDAADLAARIDGWVDSRARENNHRRTALESLDNRQTLQKIEEIYTS